MITSLIINMNKLLNSERLRAVQFTCNTRVKNITPVQVTSKISEVSPKKSGEPEVFRKLRR